jgi:hypothetical protein
MNFSHFTLLHQFRFGGSFHSELCIFISEWQLSNVASWSCWFKSSGSTWQLLWFPGTESAGWLPPGTSTAALSIRWSWVPKLLPVAGRSAAGAPPPEPCRGRPEQSPGGTIPTVAPALAA